MALTITTKEGILLMLIALLIGGMIQTLATKDYKTSKIYLRFVIWFLSIIGIFVIVFPDSLSNIIPLTSLEGFMGSINTWLKRIFFILFSLVTFYFFIIKIKTIENWIIRCRKKLLNVL